MEAACTVDKFEYMTLHENIVLPFSEALGFQEDFKKSSAQCAALEEANIAAHLKEQSMEAALNVQAKQWKETELQMENMKKSLQARIEELQQQCQE